MFPLGWEPVPGESASWDQVGVPPAKARGRFTCNLSPLGLMVHGTLVYDNFPYLGLPLRCFVLSAPVVWASYGRSCITISDIIILGKNSQPGDLDGLPHDRGRWVRSFPWDIDCRERQAGPMVRGLPETGSGPGWQTPIASPIVGHALLVPGWDTTQHSTIQRPGSPSRTGTNKLLIIAHHLIPMQNLFQKKFYKSGESEEMGIHKEALKPLTQPSLSTNLRGRPKTFSRTTPAGAASQAWTPRWPARSKGFP